MPSGKAPSIERHLVSVSELETDVNEQVTGSDRAIIRPLTKRNMPLLRFVGETVKWFLLRLLGINMADEASETMAGALKNWLGALGFIAPLVAHFVDTQHPSLPPWASIALMLAGLAIYASPVAWMRVTGRGQKPMAIAVIIVSALGLMFGIYLLARPSASAPPQTPTDDAEKPTLTGPPMFGEAYTKPPPPKNYFPNEKIELGNLLTVVGRLFDDGVAGFAEASNFNNPLPNVKPLLVQRRREVGLTDSRISNMSEYLDELVRQNPRYRSEIASVLGKSLTGAVSIEIPSIHRFLELSRAFTGDLDSTLQRYDSIDSKNLNWVLTIISREGMSAGNELNNVKTWIDQCTSRIDKMREQLK